MTDPPASLMRVLDLNECLFNYRKSSRYVPVPKDAAYRLPTSLQRLLGAARSRPQAIAKLSSKLKSADSICNAVNRKLKCPLFRILKCPLVDKEMAVSIIL